jgi:hypothetical protein
MQKLALGPICHKVTTREKPGLKVTLVTVEETMAVIMTTGIVDNRKSEDLFL